jgi:hypothetical protein
MAEVALAEIKETEATGAVAEIYADLRHALRVPMVNLIFRHMATVPGCLEWVWGNIGPLYATGRIVESAAALMADQPPLPVRLVRAELIACGLNAAALDGVLATAEAYGRANPANLLGLMALHFILDETPTARARRKPQRGLPPRPAAVELPTLPPMAEPGALPPETRELLLRLATQLHGPVPRIIPSFYRHFAAWPGLLALLAERLAPVIDSGALDEAARALGRDAHGVARVLYLDCPMTRREPPSDAALATLKDLIELFPPNICKMTLIARAVEAALAETP